MGKPGDLASVARSGQRSATDTLGREPFEPTSAIESPTHLLQSAQSHLRTTRGHDIVVNSPAYPPRPLRGRPRSISIKSLEHPHPDDPRAGSCHQRPGAQRGGTPDRSREHPQVVLPMSSAHMSETCKQVDLEQRYRRALTIAQLSACRLTCLSLVGAGRRAGCDRLADVVAGGAVLVAGAGWAARAGVGGFRCGCGQGDLRAEVAKPRRMRAGSAGGVGSRGRAARRSCADCLNQTAGPVTSSDECLSVTGSAPP
jgi:hypothetical protein